jgi:NTE family protein
MQVGLALEGGGAKGAYRMGAVKAMLELGLSFGAVAGTSIGALNGAFIAQGDFELCYRLWEQANASTFFDVDDAMYRDLVSKEIDRETISYFAAKVRDIIRQKGIDTSKIRRFLEQYIDEGKLRASETDFGLVTVSLSHMKPLELFREDIPEGQLHAYLMASANLPAFRMEPLDGEYYLDGGFYDNCPINLLVKKGLKRIMAVRTLGIGISRRIPDGLDVTQIVPSEDLGGILNFDPPTIHRNMKMGYYDAMRALRGYAGRLYCIEPLDEGVFLKALASIPADSVTKLGEALGISAMDPRRMLFEKIIPALASLLRCEASASYQQVFAAVLEHRAQDAGVDRFAVHTFSSLLGLALRQPAAKRSSSLPSALGRLARKVDKKGLFARDAVVDDAVSGFLSWLSPGDFV